MPIQIPDCLTLSLAGNPSITFPGGLELKAALNSITPPTSYEVAMALLGQLNTALAPLQPIFIILDVILAIMEFLKVVTTLSVGKMVEALKDLAEKLLKLLALLPQFSIALMILGVIDTILVFLQGLVSVLKTWATTQFRISSAPRGKYDSLDQILACTSAYLDAQVQAMSQNLGMVKYLIGLINGFMDLIGLGDYGIPDILDLSSNGLLEQVLVLEAGVDFLVELRGFIPL